MEAIEKRERERSVMGMLLLLAQSCDQWALCLQKRKLIVLRVEV